MDATQLAFPDNSFDTVITAMSTCTFPDPIAALTEIKRVCRGDGRILMLEHGRSKRNWLGNYQDRKAYSHFQGVGCRWNQEPDQMAQAAGLTILTAKRSFLGIFHTIVASPS